MKRRMQSDNDGNGNNLTYFDNVRNSNATVESQPHSAVQRVNGSFRLAHLLSMFAAGPKDPRLLGVSIDLAGLLAVTHFNARSGQVMPELPQRLQDCDLYLTMEMLETVGKPTLAVRKLFNKLSVPPSLQNPKPMAIVGTGNSASSEAVAILSGVSNIAQCSPAATSPLLDARSDHPYFTRTIPTNLGNARAAVQYYRHLGVTHVASLHVGDLYGRQFARVFMNEANRQGIDVFSVSFELGNPQSTQEAVQQIKESNRTNVFGMFYFGYLRKIADIAAPGGIMGQDGYVWILGEADESIKFAPAAEDRATRLKDTNGIGWIGMEVRENERYNAVLNSFRKDKDFQQYYLSRKVKMARVKSATCVKVSRWNL